MYATELLLLLLGILVHCWALYVFLHSALCLVSIK